jgi:hypothetical protein
LIMLGGAFVGFGDSICFTVLSYVPSSLAFPLIVGTCIVVGTTISYIVDGSNNLFQLLMHHSGQPRFTCQFQRRNTHCFQFSLDRNLKGS